MNVLVTGAGALLGQGIIRALRASRLQVHVIAADPSPLSAGLYWADEAHLIPRADDPRYLERISALLQARKPEAVLIGSDVELPIFTVHRAALEAAHGTRILVSDPGVMAVAHDKYRTYEFLRDHGFPHPDSALPDAVGALIERVGFPLVVKPRIGARSVGVRVAHDRRELDSALASGTNPVVQECVGTEAQEYTAGALCFDGRCEATIVMRRDLKDGNTYRAFVDDYPELNREVRRLAEALLPHGPVNFQFRLDGVLPKVFEINARFSGTTPLRGLAGFNEVEMCLRRVLLNEPIHQPTVERMTILRHWSETVVRNPDLVKAEGGG